MIIFYLISIPLFQLKISTNVLETQAIVTLTQIAQILKDHTNVSVTMDMKETASTALVIIQQLLIPYE